MIYPILDVLMYGCTDVWMYRYVDVLILDV